MRDFKTENFCFLNYVRLLEEQSRVIWEGRNHPEVRRWMASGEPFSFEAHQEFMRGLRRSPGKLYWTVMRRGGIVGSVCLNPYDSVRKEGESGRFLLTEYMGKGWGFQMAKEFADYVMRNGIARWIYAKTRTDNLRNQHINRKLGFRVYSEDAEYVYMELLSDAADEK